MAISLRSGVRVRAALVVTCLLGGGCAGVDVVRALKPSPYTATTPLSVENIQPVAVIDPTSPYAGRSGLSEGGIDPASIDLEQANRVFRAAARKGGLDVNLSDGDIRPVGAVEIRPALIRLDATGGTSGNALTVVGPGIRTTIEMMVAMVGPDGRTFDELHLQATGPFYESLEQCAARVASYLHGRGVARVAAPSSSGTTTATTSDAR